MNPSSSSFFRPSIRALQETIEILYTVNSPIGAQCAQTEEVRPYLKCRDQELSKGIWQRYIYRLYIGMSYTVRKLLSRTLRIWKEGVRPYWIIYGKLKPIFSILFGWQDRQCIENVSDNKINWHFSYICLSLRHARERKIVSKCTQATWNHLPNKKPTFLLYVTLSSEIGTKGVLFQGWHIGLPIYRLCRYIGTFWNIGYR